MLWDELEGENWIPGILTHPWTSKPSRRPRPFRATTYPTLHMRNRPPPSYHTPPQASTPHLAPTFRANTGTGGWSSRRSHSPEASRSAICTPCSGRVRSIPIRAFAGHSDDDIIITDVLKIPSKTKPSRDSRGKYSPLPLHQRTSKLIGPCSHRHYVNIFAFI